jgi:hypothetical protein
MPILDTHSRLAAGSGITGNAGGGGAERRRYPTRVLVAPWSISFIGSRRLVCAFVAGKEAMER